ncbi:SHOCT domain-containing protein [Lentisalinibacter salinarum]|uniref:SHOCT domain-containing protein n=1 Tax=Lentisalinibacter salinarum TaxID=2992239 RepID=UPI003864D031
MKAINLTLLFLLIAATADARDYLETTDGMTVAQFRELYTLDRADAAKMALTEAREEHGLCRELSDWSDFYSDVFHRTGVYAADELLNDAAHGWLKRRCALREVFESQPTAGSEIDEKLNVEEESELYTELRKLKGLHDEGILTDSEYESLKQKAVERY